MGLFFMKEKGAVAYNRTVFNMALTSMLMYTITCCPFTTGVTDTVGCI